MEKVNIAEKLSRIHDHWNPRIAGELNGQQVRLVKIKGEFAYHKHDDEDEMFFVIKGALQLDFKEKIVDVNEGEFLIVPKGVVHRPYAREEVSLMMFVTASNINTGDVVNEHTLNQLERI
ncbi:MAG: cupin domain-containing protein [Planctomycetota bacterium]|jgi:mannose-6-phosphate isomerase-like protein (cupin superfamily)